MTTDHDNHEIGTADALRICQGEIADGKRPAWRYLSKALLHRETYNHEPEAKQKPPVNIDAEIARQWTNPAKGLRMGRLNDPRYG